MDAAEQERVAKEGDEPHEGVAYEFAETGALRILGIVVGEVAHRPQDAPAGTILVVACVAIARMLSGTVLGERIRRTAACPGRLHGAQQRRACQGKQGDKDEGDGVLQHNGEHAEASQRHRGHTEALYDK